MNDQVKNTPNDLPKTPPDKDFQIRCPRLGHQINFPYCRSENNGLPCFKTLDCWFSYFDVHEYLKEQLSDKEFEMSFENKGKPKVLSLLDLINQAKKRQGK